MPKTPDIPARPEAQTEEDRLAALGRQWFAEVRRQHPDAETERRRKRQDADAGSWDWLFGGAGDGDGGGDAGGD
ncbi:MAG TPA: hypothetical protein VGN94_04070 [Methylobacterium sp.]|jgi:hypothetical protein|nr:hypothetical protein [Methylobacterium sp.]